LTCQKLASCFGDRLKAISPVIAAARIDGDLLVVDVNLRAVAVSFDFVEPLISGWRLFPEGRVAEFDEPRRREDAGTSLRFSWSANSRGNRLAHYASMPIPRAIIQTLGRGGDNREVVDRMPPFGKLSNRDQSGSFAVCWPMDFSSAALARTSSRSRHKNLAMSSIAFPFARPLAKSARSISDHSLLALTFISIACAVEGPCAPGEIRHPVPAAA
jgi:hypothetical protein